MAIASNNMAESTSEDEYHLHLLSVFHYVVAGLMAVSGCLPLLYVVIGVFLLGVGASVNHPGAAAPMLMGGATMLIGLFLFAVLEAIALGQFLNAMYLQTHRHHTYCLVLAVIHCLSFPLGTVLGTLTILVLIRPSVRQMFGAA